MGQVASKPRPGTKLQVIGAGLPRTGTASFSKALEILLDGPVYHGGTQITRGPECEIRDWTNVLEHTPVKSAADQKVVDDALRKYFDDGYAATLDVPGMLFVEELLQMHADVTVVCTVRDPEAWVRSMARTAGVSLQAFLSFALFLLPTMRLFPRYISVIPTSRWAELFGKDGVLDDVVPDLEVWRAHQDWLKRVVPANQLIFYHVKEGWEPLCKALGKPVPDVPFPMINDGDAMDAFAKQQILRGLGRWAIVFGTVAAAVGSWWWLR